ncbi:hypothetical protein Ahy_B01g054038 [Arachis hypogaea]|uniref:PB1-like domain-containing protein n=1 Tax=Arachis hypogaea TaxID=3818 RepID=A0A445AT45_ARAHY|nr:hypothetical protein Ahy_B01g054038 [Arachis hypogaea]
MWMDGTASFHDLKVENVWLRGVRCHCDSVVRSLLVKEGEAVHRDHTKMETLMDIITCLGDLDEDTFDVFFVRNYYKELGYDNILQCWWLPPGRSLDGGLRALTSDVVDVYFENGVSTPEVIAGKEVVVWVDDTCEGDLVSKKNTSEGPEADGNTSNPTTEPNPIPNANPSPINNPIPIPLKPTLLLFQNPLMITQPQIQCLLRLIRNPI